MGEIRWVKSWVSCARMKVGEIRGGPGAVLGWSWEILGGSWGIFVGFLSDFGGSGVPKKKVAFPRR